jgi:hypothetical protein
LARFVVLIDMPPKVISILSVSSTATATAVLRALLARFDSPFVAHHDADFVGGIPSAIQPPSHSPTTVASRSGSAKLSMQDSMPLKAEIVPPRLPALSSTSASAGRYRLCENPTTDVMGNQEFFTVIAGAASSAEPAAVGAAR